MAGDMVAPVDGLVAMVTAFLSLGWDNYRVNTVGFYCASLLVMGLLTLILETTFRGHRPDKDSERVYRDEAQLGCWSCLLAPFALLPDKNDTMKDEITTLLVYATLPALVYTMYENLSGQYTVSVQGRVSKILLFCGWVAILLKCSRTLDFSACVLMFCIFSVLCVIQCKLTTVVPVRFPKTFTMGEITIIIQGLAIFMLRTSLDFYKQIWNIDKEDSNIICCWIEMCGLAMLLLLLVLYVSTLRFGPVNEVKFYGVSFVLTVIAALQLSILIGENPARWLRAYITERDKVKMLLYWCTLVGVSVIIVIFFNVRKNNTVTTATRKFFHCAMLAVYVPGIMFTAGLLKLVSGMLFILFIYLESIRVLKIRPFGEPINRYCKVFLDKQDGGRLMVTPLYLLLGCSLPLWMETTAEGDAPVCLFSGLISIGIGDSAASLIGYNFGRHKWPSSRKTVEGTVAAFVAMFASIVALQHCGLTLTTTSVFRAALYCLSTALLEAFTGQIDNLVLPIFLFGLFKNDEKVLYF